MKPPDLQALVERHGGYDRITAEAWREHDAAMTRFHARVRGPAPLPVSRIVAASNKDSAKPRR